MVATGSINDFRNLLLVSSAKADDGGLVMVAGRDVLCFIYLFILGNLIRKVEN